MLALAAAHPPDRRAHPTDLASTQADHASIRENDPNVCITASEFAFADLTEGDFFAYVFNGDTIDRPEQEGLDVPALACGEVGVGAVEGQP